MGSGCQITLVIVAIRRGLGWIRFRGADPSREGRKPCGLVSQILASAPPPEIGLEELSFMFQSEPQQRIGPNQFQFLADAGPMRFNGSRMNIQFSRDILGRFAGGDLPRIRRSEGVRSSMAGRESRSALVRSRQSSKAAVIEGLTKQPPEATERMLFTISTSALSFTTKPLPKSMARCRRSTSLCMVRKSPLPAVGACGSRARPRSRQAGHVQIHNRHARFQRLDHGQRRDAVANFTDNFQIRLLLDAA